ncbi:hypothetical protein BDV98DRAFT_567998 [Pterulicium gracile]|uniref:FAD/NAD(P)-binding domain-containing protein n=1 Tax=Pterulicium gracile TaxID=1884261 RepID=A0A5C3QJ78_9AGAR|nr:hypothetical protein BDV98DRAFT_567998 [Pterula gracilis]
MLFAAAAFAVLIFFAFTSVSAKRSRAVVDQELKNLGSPRLAPRLGKVVICGGGISGILAAKTCLTHFEQVVLVDPEFSKSLNGMGKGRVMQYHSIHFYLFLFIKGLCRLWPSFEQKAQEAGWHGQYARQAGLYLDGTYIPSLAEGLAPVVNLRRCTFETLLGSLLIDDPQAKTRLVIIEGTVRGMKRSVDGTVISAVYGKGIDEKDFEVDAIDLLIDCTGRAQSGVRWLEQATFESPRCIIYKPHLRYTTIQFTGLTEDLFSTLPIPERHRYTPIGFLPDADISQRGVVFGKMDNGSAHLAFFSWGSSKLPKKPEDIVPSVTSIGFTNSVPSWFVDMLEILVEHGSPVIVPVHLSACNLLEYHGVRDLPANFIALGDAVMTVNPLLGQGCAKAMSDVLLLDSMLRLDTSARSLSSTFSNQLFKTQAKRNESLWSVGKYMDYAYPTTEPSSGETLNNGRFTRWMAKLFVQASQMDKHVAHVFWLRRHLLASEAAMVDPSVLVRAVWANVKRALGYHASPS